MKTVSQVLPGVQSVVAVEGDQMVTGTVQDCTPIAERAKAMHREGRHGSADMRLAADFPLVIVEKYCNDAGITVEEWMRDATHMRRMLNDPGLSDFRIWPGRI